MNYISWLLQFSINIFLIKISFEAKLASEILILQCRLISVQLRLNY